MLAFGKPIKIIEPEKMDSASVIDAVKAFLVAEHKVFKVEYNSLQLHRVEKVLNKWYVSFGQQFEHKGEKYDVKFTEVQFTINNKGEVFAFKVTYYNNIQIPNKIIFPISAVFEKVEMSLNELLPTLEIELNGGENKNATAFQSEEDAKKYIIPKYNDGEVKYHLVHQINTTFSEDVRLFESFVDVYSGEIIWQRACLMDYEAKIKLSAKTFNKYNFEPEETFALPNAHILVDGNNIVLDENGEAMIGYPAQEVKFMFESELTNVQYTESYDYGATIFEIDTIKFTITEGNNNLILDGNNSKKYSRFFLHHINVAKDFILGIDPSLFFMYNPMSVTMCKKMMGQVTSPNAAYIPSSQSFLVIAYDNDTLLLSTCPSVVYHEYGHAINDLFYKSKGTEFTNGACHEGIADVNANFILDDPIGTQKIYVNNPDRYIRNSDNLCIYPDSMNNQVHNDGKIIAGAFWDLRVLTSLETASHLYHYARYELPDDVSNYLAYMDWFIAVLIADDDDGNLTNAHRILLKFAKRSINIILALIYLLCKISLSIRQRI